MAFVQSSLRNIVYGVVATLASALLIYFGNGMEPHWPLMWLALVPVLCFALRTTWPGAVLASAAAMLLGNLNLWSYLTKTLGAPAWVWLANFSLAAAVFAVAVLLMRVLVLRGAVWSSLVALPSLWVTMEYLRNVMTPHGSAGSLAYSQLGFLPFLQLASITGPWGMTFVLLLFSCAVAIAWHLRASSPKQAMQIAAAGAGVTALVLIFGAIRLTLPQGRTARVGLIASDAKQHAGGTVADPGAPTERLFADYADAASAMTAQGAQAVVIPEKIAVTLEGKSAASDGVLQSFADRSGATVIAGTVHVEGAAKYNEARVYQTKDALKRYDKEHMLPPFESPLTPGTSLVVLPRGADRWGVAICKDMDFADPARRYGRERAGLLLVPAWDFVVDRSWHGHIAVMRGVEDGFSIARAAKNGYLTVSDWRGRIVAERPSDAAEFATLVTDVSDEHHWTVYQVLGDWFAWASVALLIVVLLRLMTTRKPATA
ncbi:MAG TPA: nitrilase-related carbon-nitrogen hydrolase [Edaphobacter sp.]